MSSQHSKDSPNMNQLIKEVRERALPEIERELECFHPSDVETFKKDDFTISRFLRRKQFDVDESAKMVVGTMKWRKELSLPTLGDTDFPAEFFSSGFVFSGPKDREGNGLVYMRAKFHRRIKEMEHLTKQFLMYSMNKVDRDTGGRGMGVIIDCRGGGLSNIDMNLAWFMVSSFINYSPDGVRYILIYEMPRIFIPAWTIVKGWLPAYCRDLVKFASQDQIYDYVDPENLPRCFGGSNPLDYRAVPEGCRPINEFDLPEKATQRIIKLIEFYQDEDDKMMANQCTASLITKTTQSIRT